MVVCGGVCGSLWWSVVVCGGLWWSVVFTATLCNHFYINSCKFFANSEDLYHMLCLGASHLGLQYLSISFLMDG